MILSESEKNRIRGLHKEHSVIKEQQGTPMGIMYGSCDPNTTGGPIDARITLNGQDITQNDIGKEISFPTVPGWNGKIDSIFPATNLNFSLDAVETPCPPPPTPALGIVFQSCDPYTTPSQVNANITLDGQMLGDLPNQGVGTEISIQGANQTVNGSIASVFIATNNTTINVTTSPCPPPPTPALGIVFQPCDPNTTSSQINANITLDGQMLANVPNQGVGTEIAIQGQNQTVNGIIDSVFIATQNLSPGLNVTTSPCPPPQMPPMGIIFGSCDPNTTPTQIPVPISVNGVPVTQSDVGKEIVVNPGPQQTHGRIDSLLVATQNLQNLVDVIETPCPPPTMPPMGIELKLCGQPNTMPMSIDADVTIDGQPVTGNDVGKEISAGGPNTHGTVDSVFVSTNPNQAAPFISKPCPLPPPPENKLCEKFMSLGKAEQKDFCYSEACTTPPFEQMCKCCKMIGL